MPKVLPVSFYFIGNHVVLDFINTKAAANGKPVDLLGTYFDLLNWLSKAKFFTQDEIEAFLDRWSNRAESNYIVDLAKELRDELASIVQRYQQHKEISEQQLENINHLLQHQVMTTQLKRENNHFIRNHQILIKQPHDLLIPIAQAAVDFFCNYDLSLIKKCANPDCVLIFYDNSKNGTRRWCSQKACGNRMKVNAYLERQKQK